MNQLENQRVALLIDAENLEIQAKNNYNAKIDYRKLLQETSSRIVVRALYFKPFDKLPKYRERALTGLGFEVKTPPKNVDTWLTISAVTLAEKCDVVLLMGGDADYLPLIWYLQSKGVRTEVWMWPDCTSAELKALADHYRPLTTEFLLNKSNNLITLATNRR